jgi:hypothetical protein
VRPAARGTAAERQADARRFGLRLLTIDRRILFRRRIVAFVPDSKQLGGP